MNLSLVIIVLMLLGAFVCSSFQNKQKVYYITWCSLIFLLSVSFKSAYYGTHGGGGADTLSYVQLYKDILNMSFGDVWQEFVDRYFQGNGESDIGYSLLQWVISRFTDSYHMFSTISDLLFFIPFAILLNKYCSSIIGVFLAFLLYLALFHSYAMYGGRQFYAIGFGIMFFLYYSENNYMSAVLYLLLGITIHMSLLLVLIPFALSFLPNKIIKRIHIVTLISTPVVLLAANSIIIFMGNFIGSEKYTQYGTGVMGGSAITYILLCVALSIICLILTDSETFEDSRFKYIYAMAPAFTFFAPLIASNGTMIRITAYSQIYETVLIPYLFTYKFGKNAKYYLCAMIVVLCFLILKGNHYPYEFFWTADPRYLW